MADPRPPRGFALITVLWLLSTIGVVALAATALGRDEFDAATNRVALERALWEAQGCAARIRSAIADSLAAAGDELGAATRVWRGADRIVSNADVGDGACTVSVEASGSRLDLNGATGEELDRLFDALGLADDAADLRDALLDWIDADSEPRQFGAEADWYRLQGRLLPRNAPIASVRELAHVRGFEALGVVEPFVSVEDPRVCIATAPAEVLSAIPAFSPAIVDRILEMRAAGTPINDLVEILNGVPESDADSALARFPEIQRLTTLFPDIWILTVRATIRATAPAVSLEQRLALSNDRPIVMRTRIIP